jgi:membrane fusion protein (multidrug efflux system)
VRRAAAKGEVKLAEHGKAKVEITLPDGDAYDQTGTLDFSDTAVAAATGAVTLRGIVPNPQHRLLPGMYVNVRLSLGELKHAWLVSQLAVQRDGEGAYVLVVGQDGKVAQKRIKATSLKGDNWVVTEGLADGDQVIVSGIQKVQPGAPAKAVPWQPAAANAAPAAPAPAH